MSRPRPQSDGELPRAREPEPHPSDEPPPFGGSWLLLYALVLADLLFVIWLCAWITGHNA